MKKLVAILVVCGVLLTMVTACKTEGTSENTTTNTQAEIETTEQMQLTTEYKTEASTGTNENKIIKIKNEKYSFTFEKNDFEHNYSEDFLMEVSKLVPMEFGYDDYDNWNGTPNEVVNDVLHCMKPSRSHWFFERYSADSPQWIAAEEEISTYPYEVWDNYVVTDINCINKFIEENFGPQARQFKPEDFDTYGEVVTENGSVTEGFGLLSYRYIYLPESEMVLCCMSETTGFEVPAAYIYDIQTVDDKYIVKAVSGSDNYIDNTDTFDGIQGDTLRMFEKYTSEYLTDYTMILVRSEEGDLYVSSVTKKYILADNIKCNYKVTTNGEAAEVKYQKYFSKGMETVGTLSDGDKVYVDDMEMLGKRLVITEEFVGWVETKYLISIE